MPPFHPPRGRGTGSAPANRFEALHVSEDLGAWEEIAAADPDLELKGPRTTYLRDDSQSIISSNQSPDLGFTWSLNPYRGCEHGCTYCYARPYHEYLGFNAGLDFESRIMVKPEAPQLLEEALAKPNWKPATIVCSGVTDCYQPVERKLKITRACLRVLADFRNPVGIVTKNALVTRDADHLAELASHDAAVVVLSITTLNPDLATRLEPRASTPQARLRALRTLTDAGIPVGVSVAPLIPGLNDHEIPAILEAAAARGARFASHSVVRLPHSVSDIFTTWLDTHFPDKKETVLGRIREMRGGKLNESEFGARMTGKGPIAEQIHAMMRVGKQRWGLDQPPRTLSVAAFRRRLPGQLELF